MSDITRRDFHLGLAALAALAGAPPTAASAQSTTSSAATPLATSNVFRFGTLPVKTNAVGGESRAVTQGTLPTGEFVEVHETMLPAGEMPHAPHRHRHSEFLLIQQGTLEYLKNGKPEPVGPGDVIFSASMVPHGIKNVGTTPAKYFVVAVGVQSVPEPV